MSLDDLVGVPFVDGGRDPKEGLDCWGLFLLVQKRFGNDVPDYRISAFKSEKISRQAIQELAFGPWQKVDWPNPGDAVLMALVPGCPDLIQHFGVYLGAGKFIQTVKKTGSITTRVDHPFWRNKIKGYCRWKKP